ncbi:DUF4255 domain-containing protein [Sorangium sp. KYC3313]|uniref:DUF4255 domain-containing protein n=1 Tax=Sorangium sp. KYC3313 TaxID=3449740 RepID=UPI003F8A3A9D
MSNSLAIATVTGTLVNRVQALINSVGLTGYDASSDHPKTDPSPGVYLSLYHLAPNPALRNLDLPTRRSSGEPSQRPVLALSLRYLFSFVGDAALFEAERLAGLVLADLHARPVLTPDEITTYLGTLGAGHYLLSSDLGRQIERVKLAPLNLDTEELSRVWGLYNQSFFALSMAWEATAVLLDGAVEPRAALPVATTGLAVRPAITPALTRLYEASSRQPVAGVNDELVIEGTGLLGEVSRVFIGAASVGVGAADLHGGALRVSLSTVTGLLPGVHAVVVEHQVHVPGAAGPGLRPGGASNPLALMVRPTLGAMSSSVVALSHRRVRVAVTPLPSADQSVELALESTTGPERRSSRKFTIDAADVVFDVADLPNGTWRVRVSIDGADSLPTMTAGVYTGPTLTVP